MLISDFDFMNVMLHIKGCTTFNFIALLILRDAPHLILWFCWYAPFYVFHYSRTQAVSYCPLTESTQVNVIFIPSKDAVPAHRPLEGIVD